MLEEARFFGIEQLGDQLEAALKVTEVLSHVQELFVPRCLEWIWIQRDSCFQNTQPPDDHSPISRKEFVRFLLATPTKSELRCQVRTGWSSHRFTVLLLRRCRAEVMVFTESLTAVTWSDWIKPYDDVATRRGGCHWSEYTCIGSD